MGGADGPGKSDRVVTIEALKEKEKGIMTMSPQQDVVNEPEPKSGLESSEFRKFCREPMKRLA